MPEPSLTKSEWETVLNGLLAVPVKRRTAAWRKALSIALDVVTCKDGDAEGARRKLSSCTCKDGTHDERVGGSCPEMKCSICGKKISEVEDFVFRALDGVFNHYDCIGVEVFFENPDEPKAPDKKG